MTLHCTKCGKEIDLPTTRWIKQEIVIDEHDESCLRTIGYCIDCVGFIV